MFTKILALITRFRLNWYNLVTLSTACNQPETNPSEGCKY